MEFKATTRKARKEYHCGQCGTLIERGQFYTTRERIDDGQEIPHTLIIYQWKACTACVEPVQYPNSAGRPLDLHAAYVKERDARMGAPMKPAERLPDIDL